MASLHVPTRLEPSVAQAIWRCRWLVLVLALVGAGAGGAYAVAKPKVYTAHATVAASASAPDVASASNAGAGGSGQQSLSSALVLLQSPGVAARAAAIAKSQLPAHAPSASTITSNLVVQQAAATSSAAAQTTDLVQVDYSAGGARAAAVGANAVLQAYGEARAAAVRGESNAALANVNGSLASVANQLDSTKSQLAALEAKLEQAGSSAQSAAQLALAAGQRVAPTPNTPNVTLDALTSQLGSLESRQNALLAQRDLIAANQQLALARPAGVVPALAPTKPSSPNRLKDILLGLAVGLVIGLMAAYPLALRRQRFVNRHEPELLYGAPLLGDLPVFPRGKGKVVDRLPVSGRPASPEAEAFRYVGTALMQRAARDGGTPTLVVTSSRRDAGKTTVVANTALALAEAGVRVLAVDADHLRRGLCRMLLEGEEDQTTAPSSGRVALGPYLAVVAISPGAAALDKALSDGPVDVVLIDAPPLLESAYASELAVQAGRAVMVLGHRDRVRRQLEAPELLSRLGVQVVGYIYNRAPRNHDLGLYYRSLQKPPRVAAAVRGKDDKPLVLNERPGP